MIKINYAKFQQINYKFLIFIISIISIILIQFYLIYSYNVDINNLQINLEDKQLQLNQKNDILNTTTNNLNSVSQDLSNTNSELDSLKYDFEYLLTIKNNLHSNLNNTQLTLLSKNNYIETLKKEIVYLENGSSYSLHDPTYMEMKNFLNVSQIDKYEYEPGYYVCRHFARDLKNEATSVGIRLAYVEFYGPPPSNINLSWNEWQGHCVVCFDTLDNGRIFIEPQNDNEINVELYNVSNNIYIKDLLIIW